MKPRGREAVVSVTIEIEASQKGIRQALGLVFAHRRKTSESMVRVHDKPRVWMNNVGTLMCVMAVPSGEVITPPSIIKACGTGGATGTISSHLGILRDAGVLIDWPVRVRGSLAYLLNNSASRDAVEQRRAEIEARRALSKGKSTTALNASDRHELDELRQLLAPLQGIDRADLVTALQLVNAEKTISTQAQGLAVPPVHANGTSALVTA